MPSRKLTDAEIREADAILNRVKADITKAAGDDPVLLFALRRRTFIRLMYWERGTPADQRMLQRLKYAEQAGVCCICSRPMDQAGSELDRLDPVLGYTPDNTRLVHHACHVADQAAKGFSGAALALPRGWHVETVMPGVDPDKPGLYEWRIEGVGSYIGQYKRIGRPRKEYGRNVVRLLNKESYRKGKPHEFRRIHHELAEAHRADRRIELIILENAEKPGINRREQELIRERGTLNGPVPAHSPDIA